MKTLTSRILRRMGFTMPELVIATAVGSVVLAGSLTLLVNLQRGFAFSTMWMDVRTREVRVLDSIGLDLRNATYVSIPTPSPGNPVLIKITMPRRYANYETSGWTAGDPKRSLSTAVDFFSSVSTTNGKPAFTTANTMLVTYETAPAGGSAVSIVRKVSWNGGPSIAPRTVASFPNGVQVTFTNGIGTTFDITKTTDANIGGSIRTTISAVSEDHNGKFSGTMKSTVLSDTVSLRMLTTLAATGRKNLY